MKSVQPVALSVQQLVDLFEKICLAQDEALLGGRMAKFNRLYDQLQGVSSELKRREGDQRRKLKGLYLANNVQVQLKAAIHTLAVAPEEARNVLTAIADTQWYPQAADAGMTIRGLDDGTFKPE